MFTNKNRSPQLATPTPEAEQTTPLLPEGHDDRDSYYWIPEPARKYWHEAQFEPLDPWDPGAGALIEEAARITLHDELLEKYADLRVTRQAVVEEGGFARPSQSKFIREQTKLLEEELRDKLPDHVEANRARLVSYIEHGRHLNSARELHERAQQVAVDDKRRRERYSCPVCQQCRPSNGEVTQRVLGMPHAHVRLVAPEWRLHSCLSCYIVAVGELTTQLGNDPTSSEQTRLSRVCAVLERR